jgi:TRAP-type C4-dicarboxylate transport system permease small subunit
MRVVYSIFGELAVLFGIAIALWVAYNLFVHRLPEFESAATPISYLFPFVMIAVGLGMLRKGIRGIPEHEVPDDSEERR